MTRLPIESRLPDLRITHVRCGADVRGHARPLQQDAAVLPVDGRSDQLPPLDLIEAAQLFPFTFAVRNLGREMQQSSRRRWGSYNRG